MPNYVQALEVGADLAKSLGVDLSHCAAEIWRPATRTAESVFTETELAKMAEAAANPIVIKDAPSSISRMMPGDFRIQLPGEGARAYMMHIPGRYRPSLPMPVVFAADGLQSAKTEVTMATANHFNELADVHGFIAAYPIAQINPQSPMIRVWNLGEQGLIKFDGPPRDAEYFQRVHQDIFQRVAGDKSNFFGIGHSAGGQYVNYLSATEPVGTFRGIASVNGTRLVGQALPKPGISGVFIHGLSDSMLPYDGGAGPNLARIERLIGKTNIEKSAPLSQFKGFAAANGFEAEPATEANELFMRRSLAKPSGVAVTEYLVKDAGHSYPGSTASSLKLFGEAMKRDQFDASKTIVNEFAIRSGK